MYLGQVARLGLEKVEHLAVGLEPVRVSERGQQEREKERETQETYFLAGSSKRSTTPFFAFSFSALRRSWLAASLASQACLRFAAMSCVVPEEKRVRHDTD